MRFTIRIQETLPEDTSERDVGKLGVWRVSSAKPGNGTCTMCVCWDDSIELACVCVCNRRGGSLGG